MYLILDDKAISWWWSVDWRVGDRIYESQIAEPAPKLNYTPRQYFKVPYYAIFPKMRFSVYTCELLLASVPAKVLSYYAISPNASRTAILLRRLI